ncbi:MAG: alpha/beta fold hydrolase [Candidatus Woesearchaeota archaeon]
MQEKVFFENSNGIKLCGILSNNGNPVIILCHGFSTSKESRTYVKLEAMLNDKGFSTFRFDFFGHGESGGKFEDITISEAVDDVLNAIKFLKRKGYARIGLMGSSFGGMASLLAASRTNELFVLALKCPVSDYLGKLVVQGGVGQWKEKGYCYYESGDGRKLKLNYSFLEDAEKVSGYEAAKKIRIPTLIVHGDKDETVPVDQSKKTASIIENCRLEVIEGEDHHFSKDNETVLKLISEFIAEEASCFL